MAQVLVRNLKDETKSKLQARAQSKGRSLEAEVRDILEAAAAAEPGIANRDKSDWVAKLAAVTSKLGVTKADIKSLKAGIDDSNRDRRTFDIER